MPVWTDGRAVRGYKVEQFGDAFHRVLGVRGVSGVSSESSSQTAPNSPNAPNVQHTREGTNRTPIIGDPDYLALVVKAHENGHLTREALDRQHLHNLIVKALGDATEAAGEEEAESAS
jgi:hypothetical protein